MEETEPRPPFAVRKALVRHGRIAPDASYLPFLPRERRSRVVSQVDFDAMTMDELHSLLKQRETFTNDEGWLLRLRDKGEGLLKGIEKLRAVINERKKEQQRAELNNEEESNDSVCDKKVDVSVDEAMRCLSLKNPGNAAVDSNSIGANDTTAVEVPLKLRDRLVAGSPSPARNVKGGIAVISISESSQLLKDQRKKVILEQADQARRRLQAQRALLTRQGDRMIAPKQPSTTWRSRTTFTKCEQLNTRHGDTASDCDSSDSDQDSISYDSDSNSEQSIGD